MSYLGSLNKRRIFSFDNEVLTIGKSLRQKAQSEDSRGSERRPAVPNGLRAVWDEEKVWKQITMTVTTSSVYLNSVSKMLSFIPYIFYHMLTKH